MKGVGPLAFDATENRGEEGSNIKSMGPVLLKLPRVEERKGEISKA